MVMHQLERWWLYYFEYDQYGLPMNNTGIQATMLTCRLSSMLPRIHVPCHPFQDENVYHIALLAKPMHACVYIYQPTCPRLTSVFYMLICMKMYKTLDLEEYSCINGITFYSGEKKLGLNKINSIECIIQY